MADQLNDSEIKALLNFFIILGAKVEKIIANGSISILDLPGFFSAFSAASPALSGLKSLPSELSSLNDASLNDIRSYIQANLPNVIPNASVDALINEGLALGQQLFDFINSIKGVQQPSVVPPQPAPSPAPAPAAPSEPSSGG